VRSDWRETAAGPGSNDEPGAPGESGVRESGVELACGRQAAALQMRERRPASEGGRYEGEERFLTRLRLGSE